MQLGVVMEKSDYVKRIDAFEAKCAAADTVEKVAVATFGFCGELRTRERALLDYIDRVIESGEVPTLEGFRNHLMALAVMYSG